ncbi:hypothetical protein M1446_05340 [Candidatus Dependentiae bacterium]|nr:hypothetical protein [Candidatus Dependentiae bacterium]
MNKKLILFLVVFFNSAVLVARSNHHEKHSHKHHNSRRHRKPWLKWWWWNQPAYFNYPLNGYLWTDYGWKYNHGYKICIKNYYRYYRMNNPGLSKEICRAKAFKRCYKKFYR